MGDPDWGELEVSGAEEGRSRVYDYGSGDFRDFTVEIDEYGSGSGSGTVQIRGSETEFTQDAGSPSWEDYSSTIRREWRYVQVRILGPGA